MSLLTCFCYCGWILLDQLQHRFFKSLTEEDRPDAVFDTTDTSAIEELYRCSPLPSFLPPHFNLLSSALYACVCSTCSIQPSTSQTGQTIRTISRT